MQTVREVRRIFPITDNFGDLGNQKNDLCLCEECKGLFHASDPEFGVGLRIILGSGTLSSGHWQANLGIFVYK